MDPIILELTRRYTDPARSYHNLDHIARMLATGGTSLSDAQTLAVWFHDAVYEPGSGSNEEDSAALAAEMLAGRIGGEVIDEVCGIILDTKSHVPTRESSKRVIDLDLMGLADPWPAFAETYRAVMAEFVPNACDEATFIAGNREVFAGFLARERIFHTDWGRPFEAPARRNLGVLVGVALPERGAG